MAQRYRLTIGKRTVDLPPGEYVVGRSAECQIVVQDELTSRRHARIFVTGLGAELEDLGSRNGVLVNGEPAIGRVKLGAGARIGIGEAELRLEIVDARASGAPTTAKFATPSSPARPMSAPAGPTPASGMTGATFTGVSAAAAIFQIRAALHTEEVGPLRDATLRLRKALGTTSAADAALRSHAGEAFAEAAFALARLTRDPDWLDALFDVQRELGRVIDPGTVKLLAALIAELPYRRPEACQRYVEALRARTPPLGPEELPTFRQIELLGGLIAG